MDKQLIFDTAVKKLLKQNALSKVERPEDHGALSCVYFDPITQNRCLVGLLVTKRQAATLERNCKDQSATVAVENYPQYFEKYGALSTYESHKRFLNSLQRVHDNALNMEGFQTDARQFANMQELNTNVLDQQHA